MRVSHRVPAFIAASMLAAGAWAQAPNSGDPPPSPSIESGQPHAAHPDAGGSMPAQGMRQMDPRPTAGTDPDPLAAKAVTDFVDKATIDGLTEIQLGRLALSHSQNDGVLKFAQQMITDHEQADSALGAVASLKNVSAPKEIDAAHQAMVQSLAAKQGRAFDAAYLDQMLIAHQRAIALYTAAAGQTDSEIAAFAYKSLPTLKSHRQMAQTLKRNGKSAA